MGMWKSIKLSLAHFVFGFDKEVRIYRKVGGIYIKDKDYAKCVTSPLKVRQLKLYNELIGLPYPPAEAVLEDRITLWSPRKGQYAYVVQDYNFDEKKIRIVKIKNEATGETEEVSFMESKVNVLDSDIVFWQEQEVKEANLKYVANKDKSFLEAYFPYIIIGIFIFILMLVMVIGWQQIVKPALLVAKNFATANVTCNFAGIPNLPHTNVTPPL
jgi:hypothetical protein